MNRNISNYRYDRVTMGVLMSDFMFNKDSPKSGDAFPDFKLETTDGKVIIKEDFLGKQPLLLVFGSVTCPMTASSIAPLKELHAEFGDQVTFITLNVREAHPAENVRQPNTSEQKRQHARLLKEQFGIPWSVVSDDIDGTLHRALDTKPNAAYLMNTEGQLVFRSLWAGDRAALRVALKSVIDEETPVLGESTRILGPIIRSMGYFNDVFKRAGPQAMRDMLLAAPPVAIVGKTAGLFRRLDPDRRGILALLTVLVTLGVLVGFVAAVI